MARICPVTKKSSKVAGNYSNRTRATKYNPTGKVRRKANLQTKRLYIPELDKTVRVTLSTKAIREISKNGAYKTLKKAGIVK